MYKFIHVLLVVAAFFLSSCSSNLAKYRVTDNYTSVMSPAQSMSELDRQSRDTKPHLIYSYPKNRGTSGANFVNLDPIKYKILNYINSVRAKGNACGASAPPLAWNAKLEDAAIAHAQDMSSKNFLGHIGSGSNTDLAKKALGEGSNFYERIIYFGYPIKPQEVAGEIITYTKYRVVGSEMPYKNFTHAVDNFLHSPKHCAILMNPRFHDVAVASYKDNVKMYWVIEFAEVNY